jgi:hypothetical protein
MRGSAFQSAVLPILAVAIMTAPAHAADSRHFLLAASDGYGVQDCLAEGGECGHAVADAWCAAQGSARAVDFGRADAAKGGEGGYYITCGD